MMGPVIGAGGLVVADQAWRVRPNPHASCLALTDQGSRVR